MGQYFLETLGCPKNQVDSDKLEGYLAARGFQPAGTPEHADLVVVNTCAFIDRRAQESIDTVLDLADRRRNGARLVVTGCMAERYGDELRDALPEVDLVAGFGRDIAPADQARRSRRTASRSPSPPPDRSAGPRSPTSTSSACPARPPRLRGPTSRWPRGATASAASAPSPPSGVASAHAARRTSWPRSTSWPRAHRARLPSARSCWWPRTSRPTGATVRSRAEGRRRPLARGRAAPAPWPSASTAPGCSTSIPRA